MENPNRQLLNTTSDGSYTRSYILTPNKATHHDCYMSYEIQEVLVGFEYGFKIR
jgi:hypothetical protein